MRSITLGMLLLIVVLPCQVLAQNNVRKISVTGRSETAVDAQYAVIRLGIKLVRKDMSQSHGDLTKTVGKVTSAIARAGLRDTTIKRSVVVQGPEYGAGKNAHALAGYYAQCQIEVRVDEMTKLPLVYRELANLKNVTIEDTDFKRHDDFSVRKNEYEKAIQDAKMKAEYMAQTLQTKVGKVLSIQELRADEEVCGKAAAPVKNKGVLADVAPGNIKVTTLVAVEFELE